MGSEVIRVLADEGLNGARYVIQVVMSKFVKGRTYFEKNAPHPLTYGWTEKCIETDSPYHARKVLDTMRVCYGLVDEGH